MVKHNILFKNCEQPVDNPPKSSTDTDLIHAAGALKNFLNNGLAA